MDQAVLVKPEEGVRPTKRSVFVSDFKVGEFFKIYLINMIFTICTLGIYRFWAKTRERKYLFSRIVIMGDSLEYHGTGKELFKGFLIIFILIILPFGVLPGLLQQRLLLSNPEIAVLIAMLQAIGFSILLPVAIYRAYRYLFSRLSWRGVRFSLARGELGFAWRFTVIGSVIFFVLPFWYRTLYTYTFNRLSFGNKKFQLVFLDGPLWRAYGLMILVLTLLMSVVVFLLFLILGTLKEAGADMDIVAGLLTFGVYLVALGVFKCAFPIFKARLYRVVGSNLKYGRCSFQADIRILSFVGLTCGNLLILLFTLGLGYPLVLARNLKYWAQHLTAENLQEFEKVMNVQRDELTTGEGLASNFDIGGI